MSKEAKTAAPAKAKVQMDPRLIGRLTGTLLGICAVVALLLGITNYVTEPIITQLQTEKTNAAMAQVLPAGEYRDIDVEAEGVSACRAAYDGGTLLGWVVEVTANGSQGAIQMVVGVDTTGAVTGVSVTKHSETANLGTKVVNDQNVLSRFVGMSHANGEITVNSGSNRFDGVSGATISSKGVAAGVNTALNAVAPLLTKEG